MKIQINKQLLLESIIPTLVGIGAGYTGATILGKDPDMAPIAAAAGGLAGMNIGAAYNNYKFGQTNSDNSTKKSEQNFNNGINAAINGVTIGGVAGAGLADELGDHSTDLDQDLSIGGGIAAGAGLSLGAYKGMEALGRRNAIKN